MKLARSLVLLSSAVFAVTGLGYLLAPGAMLSVVGIEAAATNEFLIRTEGVALLCGAALLWAVRGGTPVQLRLALVALAGYYALSTLVDLSAFAQDIVGTAAVPSAAARILAGGLCLLAAVRLPGGRAAR